MKHYTGKEIIKACEKADCRIVNGRGDHVKVYKDGEMMVIPYREIGTGLMFKIVKWCVKMGIVLTIVFLVIVYLNY